MRHYGYLFLASLVLTSAFAEVKLEYERSRTGRTPPGIVPNAFRPPCATNPFVTIIIHGAMSWCCMSGRFQSGKLCSQLKSIRELMFRNYTQHISSICMMHKFQIWTPLQDLFGCRAQGSSQWKPIHRFWTSQQWFWHAVQLNPRHDGLRLTRALHAHSHLLAYTDWGQFRFLFRHSVLLSI